jgi:hypothetical protein
MFEIQNDDEIYFRGVLVLRRAGHAWPTLWEEVEAILTAIGTDEAEDYERGYDHGSHAFAGSAG